MKTLLILLFCCGEFYFVHSQDKKIEYCILRITHSVKPGDIESRLSIELGDFPNHSLKGIFTNTKGGTISVNQPDGSVVVIKNEVDFLNFISKYGYKLEQTYTFTLLEKLYTNFIFKKELP